MSINAAFKTMMQSDLAAMITDWSETLTFKGATITGTYSPVDSGDDLNTEGLLETASAEFVCNADTFDAMANVPAVRDTVDIAGVKYYIVDIARDPACVTLSVRRN